MKYVISTILFIFVLFTNAQPSLSGPSSAYQGHKSYYSVYIPSGQTPFMVNWVVTNGSYVSSTNGQCYGNQWCIEVTWSSTATSGTVQFRSGSHGNSNVKTVSLSPYVPPTPPDPPSVPSKSRCEPGPLTLSVSSPQAGLTYAWYDNNTGGSSFHTGASYTTSGLETGETQTFYVAACEGTLCSTRSPANAIIRNKPTVYAGSYAAVCEFEDINLAGSPSGGTWSGPNISGNTFQGTWKGNYTLTYTYTDQFDCSGSDDVTITVNDTPPAPLTTGDSRCGPGQVFLQADFDENNNSGFGNFNINYTWYDAGGTEIATGPTYSPSLSIGTYTYYVSIEQGPNGCPSPQTPVGVAVYDYQDPGILSISNNQYCLGSNDFPTLSVDGGDDPSYISWEMADYGSDLNNESSWTAVGEGAESFTPSALHLAESRYFRRSIRTAQCDLKVSSNHILIRVNNSVNAGTIISPVQEIICWKSNPGLITETATPTLGDGIYIHEWFASDNGTDWQLVGTGESFDPGELQVTTYFKRVDYSCFFSDETNVIVIEVENPPHIPNIGGDYFTTCVGENMQLLISPINDISYYEWTRNGSTLSNTSNTINVSPETLEEGVYNYEVFGVYNNNCVTQTQSFSVIVFERCDYWLNYITTITPQNTEETPHSIVSTAYFDGLGRNIQNVGKSLSPSQRDVVVSMKYDVYGRNANSYLPYTSEENDGQFKVYALHGLYNDLTTYAQSEQYMFYQSGGLGHANSQYPYAETVFDNSPLKRPLKKSSPGESWVIGGTSPQSFMYGINTTNVLKFEWIDLLTTSVQSFSMGSLQKTGLEDEDDNRSWEYTNKLGQVVMKESEVEGDQVAQTYYIYDDFGRLRVVLPPEATDRLDTEFFPSNESDRQAFLDTWAFQYTYDGRGRMIEKKVPGAEKVLMVYDRWDRLVLTQDGNQREAGQWLFTKYDQLNRPVMTGLVNDRSGLIGEIEDDTRDNRAETMLGTGHLPETQYTDTSYPQDADIAEYHSITYYDNYDFIAGSDLSGISFSCPDEFKGENVDAYHLLPELQEQVKGQVTGTKTRVLNSSSDYLETITYYDSKYRVIQVVSENHLGGEDVISNQYDFVGNVRRVKSVHNDGTNNTSILMDYDYDHANRLLSCSHKLNNDSPVTLYSNEYNELGELIGKNLHYDEAEASYKQHLDYEYNIRGWLRSINESSLSGETSGPEPADLFSIELIYNSSLPTGPSN